jgi:hypothetical protein
MEHFYVLGVVLQGPTALQSNILTTVLSRPVSNLGQYQYSIKFQLIERTLHVRIFGEKKDKNVGYV